MEKQTYRQGAKASEIFNPKSIAVIGASDDVTKIGGRPIRYLNEHGFKGQVYPVNPKYREVQELKCYPSLESIEGVIDLAVIALPAKMVFEALEQCGEAKVKVAIIFSAGFAEVGPEGRKMQEQLIKLARRTGIRILGPNTLGFINSASNATLTFSSALEEGPLPTGHVGFVTQSGGVGAYCLALGRQKRVKYSYWIILGNEIDVDVPEAISFLAQDDSTSVIACYMESCKDGARLESALAEALSAGKPVVMFKAGKSPGAARAVESHTAGMAGADRSFEAVFDKYGVTRVQSVDELLDTVALASWNIVPRGPKVTIVTVSGGIGIGMTDRCEENGLEVPVLPETLQSEIRKQLPYAAVGNPIDVTAQILNQPDLLLSFLHRVIETDFSDSIVIFAAHTLKSEAISKYIVEPLIELSKSSRIPVFLSGLMTPQIKSRLVESRIPVFENPNNCIDRISMLYQLGVNKKNSAEKNEGKNIENTQKLDHTTKMINQFSSKSSFIGEMETKKLLQELNVPVVEEFTVRFREEALAAAEKIGYPVVLKGMVADVLHKSDLGLVRVSLQNEEQLIDAFNKMSEKTDTQIESFLVQEMVKNGTEILVGCKSDPHFGKFILIGLGGIFTEVFNDNVLLKAPASEREVLNALKRLKAYPLLRGYRGTPPGDIEALALAVSKISSLVNHHNQQIKELEVNPLFVLPEGQGVRAADGLTIFW